MTKEQKSQLVQDYVSDHILSFGGVYEMRDDLEVVVYMDHDSHDLWLYSYDEYLEHAKEVQYG